MAQIVEVIGIGNVEFPDGMSQEAIANALKQLPQQKNQLGIPVSPGERIMQPEPQLRKEMMDYVRAAFEIPATVLSSAALTPISATKALVTGSNKPLEMVEQYAYKPKSPVSQEVLGDIGQVLETSKIPPFLPGAVGLGSSIKQATQMSPLPSYAAAMAKPATTRMAEALKKAPEPTLSGVGSAEVPEAITRQKLAQGLREPVTLSKGQATRELGQQQFEAETAKTYPQDIGKPLIQAQLDRNDKILKNFDLYVDATGAEKAGEFNLREVGKVVDSALVKKANQAKADIKNAYQKAREAGETNQVIDVQDIKNYLDSLKAEEINAPIITSAKIKLAELAPDGQISINDLEEVRKMVRRVSGNTPTNMEFGRDIISKIDASTADKGGELYKKARQLRTNYAREFENVGYVDKLLSKKPGTTDRSVALEDVFDHSIMKGSLDDVMSIGRTLKKAGPEGQQAWKELQGQTIEHLKSAVTKNIQRDAAGNPIVSPKQFDSIVKDLDSSGKLDYLFGKKGAQEIRDLRDTAINVYTTVPGINTSNTASAINQALNRIAKSKLSSIPMAGEALEAIVEYGAKKEVGKQVQEALSYTPEAMAKELRKGK